MEGASPLRVEAEGQRVLSAGKSVHSILGYLEVTKERNALLSDKWFEGWQEGK